MSDTVDYWAEQIIFLGEGQKYPVFRTGITVSDYEILHCYDHRPWKAWACFRHGHDVRVAEVEASGVTAADAMCNLHDKLREAYQTDGLRVWPA